MLGLGTSYFYDRHILIGDFSFYLFIYLKVIRLFAINTYSVDYAQIHVNDSLFLSRDYSINRFLRTQKSVGNRSQG